jgi:hypothetical protein
MIRYVVWGVLAALWVARRAGWIVDEGEGKQ